MLGDVLLIQPISHWQLTAAAITIVLFIATYLVTGVYPRKATVPGYLVPDKGLIKVYALRSGVISHIHVKKGEQVKKYDPIFTLNMKIGLEQGGDIDTMLLTEITEQKISLVSRLEQLRINHIVLLQRLKEKVASFEQSVSQLNRQRVLQVERLELAKEQMLSLENLTRNGNVARVNYTRRKELWLEQKQSLLGLDQRLLDSKNAIDEAHYLIQLAPTQYLNNEAQLRFELSSATQREVEITGRRGHVIRSPVSGTVSTISVKEGQTTPAGLPLLALLPEDSELEANLYIPSRSIGFIETGQAIKIRFDAFPYQRYGIYKGNVMLVANNILSVNELPALIASSEPMYKVTAQLEKQQIQSYGKQWPLQAGMMIEADIVLEHSTLIRWLLDPIYSLRGKLM
jgi:membrane fusion protein